VLARVSLCKDYGRLRWRVYGVHMNAADSTACPIKSLARKMPTKYLRDFFAEKNIAEVQWSLTSNDGTAHIIGNVVVVEHIATCSTDEATRIGAVLRKIDFANGNVNHFFQHLAVALINR
jgi:hypothetical protein